MFPSTSYPLYTINFPKYWLVRDKPENKSYSPATERTSRESLFFHISAGDYLSTLATILKFFEETIKEEKITPVARSLQLEAIKNSINDLLYVEKHYTIVPKDKESK